MSFRRCDVLAIQRANGQAPMPCPAIRWNRSSACAGERFMSVLTHQARTAKKCPGRRLRSRAACRRAASCFAGTMMIGVAITLSAIAILSILLRECLVSFVEGRSRLFEAITRSIEGLAGAALIALAIHEILLR